MTAQVELGDIAVDVVLKDIKNYTRCTVECRFMISKLSCMLSLKFLCAPAWALTLVSQGSSNYTIVIPDEPIPAEQTAAQELAHLCPRKIRSRRQIEVPDSTDTSRDHQRRIEA